MSSVLERPITAHSTPRAENRKVLLVSYHFGPGSATGGIRWNAMTADLSARGWEFDVITLAREGSAELRLNRDYVLGERTRVHPVIRPSWLDHRFEQLVRSKRQLVARREPAEVGAPVRLSEADVKPWSAQAPRSSYTRLMANVNAVRLAMGDYLWSLRAATLARELCGRNRYRAVVVSSPPHITHLVGTRISRETGLAFVPDFRDPWTFGLADGFLTSGFDQWLGLMVEREVLEQATVTVCNTEWARRAVERLLVNRRARVVGIPNGSDPIGEVDRPDPTCFRVVFSGWLYPYMDPRPLLAACGRLRTRSNLGPNVFRVEFMGPEETFGSVPLVTIAQSYGLQDCFTLHPAGSRTEATGLQQAGAVLVVFDYPHPLAVPMKFYDQSRMRGSMLLIGNPRGALADAAARLGMAVYAPTDDNGIDGALDRALQRWRSGDYAQPADREGVFDRRHATSLMERVLQSVD